MHPGSLSPRFGSDREEGFAVLFVFFSSKEKRRSWEMGNEWQVVGEVTERKNRLCLIGRATCACCVSPLSQHCYTPSFRSTKVRNGGSLPPVGFDGGNSRPPVSARLPQDVGLGKMVRRMDEKKLLLLQLSSKAEKKIPLAPSMFHGQSGPRSDFFFSLDPAACCLMDDHGLACPCVSLSHFFLSSTTSYETLLPFKIGVNVAARLHSSMLGIFSVPGMVQ
jgi:hypothetical protein